MASVKLTVKWVPDESPFAHIMVSCEFMDFPETLKRRIERFIDAQTAGGRRKN